MNLPDDWFALLALVFIFDAKHAHDPDRLHH
jgi:hypothetical protein